jgi:hypothetical protein
MSNKKVIKEIYESQWLQPIKNEGTQTVYKPTIDFLTEEEAKKKGLTFCIQETKRLRVKNPPALKEIEDLLYLCKVNLEKFDANAKPEEETEEKETVFEKLVKPYLDKLVAKYKVKYSKRQYAIYFSKRQEAKAGFTTDFLNKDNKKGCLWLQIRWEILSLHDNFNTYTKFDTSVRILQKYKELFFTTTQEQRERILKLDPTATFPNNELVETKLDYFDLEATLLNEKNELRGPWYYPNLEAEKLKLKKREKVVIKPEELSFLHAHGGSMCMIRYKGLYYGYYASNYAMDHKDEDDENIHHDMGLTREQTIAEIKKEQRLSKPFVKDCFPRMNTKQIQEHCIKRLEKLDATNYTNNDNYAFDEAMEFCQKHRLDDVAKYIFDNFPDRKKVKENIGQYCKIPLYDYAKEGNLDMIKFFHKRGVKFSRGVIEHAGTENQLAVFEFLFKEHKDDFYRRDVGYEFMDRLVDEAFADRSYFDILNFLAKEGYFSDAIKESKKENSSYYNKEMAEMFEKHKAIYSEKQKANKIRKEKEEKIRKQKEVEEERKRKQKLIKNLGSSNKNIHNKIKKLSSDKLRNLEEILK